MVRYPVIATHSWSDINRVTLIPRFSPGGEACVGIVAQSEHLLSFCHARNILCRVESIRVSVSTS